MNWFKPKRMQQCDDKEAAINLMETQRIEQKLKTRKVLSALEELLRELESKNVKRVD